MIGRNDRNVLADYLAEIARIRQTRGYR